MANTKSTPWKLVTCDEILKRAKEHARKWAQASLATDLCDQEKIEALLAKRAQHLDVKPRKAVWCTSIEDLIQKIGQESTNTLLADQALFATCEKSVYRKMMSQLQTAVQMHSPTTPLNSFLATLRRGIQDSLFVNPEKNQKKNARIASQTNQTLLYLKEQLKEHLATLYAREGNKFGPIELLYQFWNDLLDFDSCRFYDCLWECLPDKNKVKNYFAHTGEMHEAGLWIYIPSRNAEYLIPILDRFFIGAAHGKGKNAPRIEWRNEELPTTKTSSGKTPQAFQDTDRILRKLEAFQGKLEGLLLHEEVSQETKKIVEKISHLLMRLRKEYPSSSLTYEVRRIADSWLIELITSYANLSQVNREKNHLSLVESLTLLDSQINKVFEELELRRVSEFDIMTTFLRDTFARKSLEI